MCGETAARQPTGSALAVSCYHSSLNWSNLFPGFADGECEEVYTEAHVLALGTYTKEW